MVRDMKPLFFVLFALFAETAFAAVQTVEQWLVTSDGPDTLLALSGIWPDGCTRPTQAQASIADRTVTILVPPTESLGWLRGAGQAVVFEDTTASGGWGVVRVGRRGT